ncbi:tetratricopeptide repeat protein [Rhizosaccharibacter radicis]|uniref:Tetratricopeptide repeat protein n=1 Tax=Rhizosaccharibacter radicis TaxID=2782605 RepID=A0ABT1VX23_9PROT|nr:tetratricopeptide repeat protein [Acetobacteraceae bacterium KSS12]
MAAGESSDGTGAGTGGERRRPVAAHVSRTARRAAVDRVASAHARRAAGDAAGAERLFRQALALHPDQPDALHGLAELALDAGRPGLAIGLAGKAVAGRPNAAGFFLTLGRALQEEGHLEEARAAFSVAVLRDPDDLRGRFAIARLMEMQGRVAEAGAALDEAEALAAGGGLADLVAAAKGGLLQRAGRPLEALPLLRRATEKRLEDWAAWHSRGAAAAAAGLLVEAELCFARVRALRPGDGAAAANLGSILFELNRIDEAVAMLEAARDLGPATPETMSNLGLALMAAGDLSGADRALQQAEAAAPLADEVVLNRGTVLFELQRAESAAICFRAVLDRAGEGTTNRERARFNLSTVLLSEGRFEEGWTGFEARRSLLGLGATLPPWDGSDGPEPVLLRAEQGLGDAVQFLRFVPDVLARRPVVLAVPPALQRLAGSLRIPDGSPPGRFRVVPLAAADAVAAEIGCAFEALLLSLPAVLRRWSLPPAEPYLWTAAAAPARQIPRVGVSWAGSAGYRFDRRRSLPAGVLAPLASLSGAVRFVSLQQGDAPPPGLTLEAPGEPPADLADTAGLIADLDLVISVDSAVAHLAGAMGRECWLLNRFGGDWRWRGAFADGDRSLWYPSIRLFRQDAPLPPAVAWAAPVTRLAEALRIWAEERRSPRSSG